MNCIFISFKKKFKKLHSKECLLSASHFIFIVSWIFSTSVYHKNIISIYRWKKMSLRQNNKEHSQDWNHILSDHKAYPCLILWSNLWSIKAASWYAFPMAIFECLRVWVGPKEKEKQSQIPCRQDFPSEWSDPLCCSLFDDFTVHPNTVQPCSSPGVWKEFYALSN